MSPPKKSWVSFLISAGTVPGMKKRGRKRSYEARGFQRRGCIAELCRI